MAGPNLTDSKEFKNKKKVQYRKRFGGICRKLVQLETVASSLHKHIQVFLVIRLDDQYDIFVNRPNNKLFDPNNLVSGYRSGSLVFLTHTGTTYPV